MTAGDRIFLSVILICVLIRYEETKEKFMKSLPDLDFPFYMATGVSCLCFFIYINFGYHSTIQNVRKYQDWTDERRIMPLT